MGKISDAAASKALKDVLGNVCFSKATLAINAGGAATIKTTGTTTFTVGGIFYTKGALSAQSIAALMRLATKGTTMLIVTMAGNLGKDAEYKETQGGKGLCSFPVAATVGFGDKKTTILIFWRSVDLPLNNQPSSGRSPNNGTF